MPERRSNLLLWLVVGGGAVLFFAISLLALALYFSGGAGSSFSFSSNAVAVLDLEGIIFDSKEFTDQLKDIGSSPGVRAVVLRVNSPGGGVAASQEMFEAVRKFRAETRKKVVVSMASVAASGGYYVACAADRIYANPGSITGSIGVIVEWYNYSELLKWAKLQDIVFKSGEFKDTGSPSRPLTDAEKAYFQSLIQNMYGQFIKDVAASRRMNQADVEKLADGRVYTGLEAKNNGLVDELGALQDAVAAAAKMAGIVGEPRIVTPPKKKISILDILLGDARSVLTLNPDRSESHIRFQYLWK
ncbi:MAG: signal peptide peptidase SppA [Acidobacteriia bacterium]|nr:signal peptide peptidase SppA [Terriglobia bacterium]